MNNVLDVARYIIKKSLEIEKPIDNLKLQKILYYIQACNLKNKGRVMFKENIIAYPYGPIVKEVYDEYKKNVASNIYFIENENFRNDISNEDKKICDFIIEKFKDSSAWSLVVKTHSEEPWIYTKQRNIIEIDKIERYFKGNKDYEI